MESSYPNAIECRSWVRTRAPVSEFLSVERLEFFPTGFAEVAKNVDGVAIDHLLDLRERLVRLQISLVDLSPNLVCARDDAGRGQQAHSPNFGVSSTSAGISGFSWRSASA